MEPIIKKLNNFFKHDIFEIYRQNKNEKSRDRQIKINDMLKFLFLYSNKETTKDIAAEKTNCASRTAFGKKLKNINVKFFEILFNRFVEFKDSLIQNDKELNKLNIILNKKIEVLDEKSLPFNICSGDGTCNKKNSQ